MTILLSNTQGEMLDYIAFYAFDMALQTYVAKRVSSR